MGSRYIITTVEKRKQAKLLIKLGFTNKAAAQKIHVSEKTMGAWVKEHGWRNGALDALYDNRTSNSLQDFMVFVNDKYPAVYSVIQDIYNDYQNTF